MFLFCPFTLLLFLPVLTVGLAAGQCQDKVTLCDRGRGYCFDARVGSTVRRNCPRMCGVCNRSGTRTHRKNTKKHKTRHPRKPTYHPKRCEDNSHCSSWIRRGFCTSKRYSVQTKAKFCAKSCNLCHAGRTQPRKPQPSIGPAYEPFVHSIDPNRSPCRDFYQYACGRWIREHPLSEGVHKRSVYTEAQYEVDKKVENILQTITPRSTEEAQMKRYYDLCINEPQLRLTASNPMIDRIVKFGGWPLIGPVNLVTFDPTTFNLASVIELMNRLGGIQTFITITPKPETNDDRTLNIHVSAGNFVPWMSAPDFSDPSKVEVYRNYLTELVTIIAADARSTRSQVDMRTELENVITFETELANIVQRHSTAVFEDVDYTTLPAVFLPLIRSVDTDSTFQPYLTTHPTIRVKDRSTLVDIDALIQRTAPNVVADYVVLHYLVKLAPYLDRRYVDVINDFRDRRVGQRSIFERQKYCLTTTRRLFHDLSDQLYINTHLPLSTRKEIESFIEQFRKELIQSWPSVKWMTSTDKNETLEKLRRLKILFATPNSRNRVDDIPGFGTMNFAQLSEALQRLRETESFRPVERGEQPNFFLDYKQTESYAMNNIDLNTLFITAALAVRPIYTPGTKTQALNYGALGALVSKMIGFSVDKRGKNRNSQGNPINWWSTQTDRQYTTASQCLVDKFSNTAVSELSGAQIDGSRTLIENAGDYLGIKTAYDAFRKNVGNRDSPLPGFSYTPDQVFFLSYATSNCANRDSANLRNLLTTNEAPERYKVNILLANTPAFSRAFKCPRGSAMNSQPKCQLYS
ncbi:Endothelin-converting enzyme 1-like protein [Aphelenchoides besseyi]|nr:Endothelin-converting enzyme 1-like protein [Aphelenchoides besseyi]